MAMLTDFRLYPFFFIFLLILKYVIEALAYKKKISHQKVYFQNSLQQKEKFDIEKQRFEVLKKQQLENLDQYLSKIYSTIRVSDWCKQVHYKPEMLKYESLAAGISLLPTIELSANEITKYFIENNYKLTERDERLVEIIRVLKNIDKLQKLPFYRLNRDISKMSGYDFEDLIKNHYIFLGYTVQKNAGANDMGVDLIVYPTATERGKIIQCKRIKRNLGSPLINAIAGAKNIEKYKDYDTYIVSSSDPTMSAVEYAELTGVNILSGDNLLEQLSQTVLRNELTPILKKIKEFDTSLTIKLFIEKNKSFILNTVVEREQLLNIYIKHKLDLKEKREERIKKKEEKRRKFLEFKSSYLSY